MITTSAPHRFHRHAHGFTLLEVLIALVVLSIGLLGLAGLQSTGLRFNQSAAMRTQATQLAYDMSDRMRANAAAVAAGAYLGGAGANGSCHSTGGCTPAAMAADDLAMWNAAITRYLPDGEGLICRDNTPNDGDSAADPECDNNVNSPFAIKIWWDDDRDGNLDPTPFAVAFEP